MQSARRIVLELYPDAVRAIHHVEVGHDVAVGVHHHARAQRLRPPASATGRRAIIGALAAKEAIKEIARIISAVRGLGALRLAAAAAARFRSGIRADVYHRRLHVLGHLSESFAELLRGLHGQQRGIRGGS